MKGILYCIIIIVFPSLLYAQIQNADFEKNLDKTTNLPLNWSTFRNSMLSLDSTTALSGRFSLRLQSQDSLHSWPSTFFQGINMNFLHAAEKIVISAYVKTENFKDSVQLQCSLYNYKARLASYRISPNVSLVDTNGWRKISVTFVADSSIKQVTVSGILRGNGIAWFDNFKFEEMPASKKTSPRVKSYLDEELKIAQQNSIVKEKINWKNLRERIKPLSKTITDIDSIDLVNFFILDQLRNVGDYHSLIIPKTEAHHLTVNNADNPISKPGSKLLAGNISHAVNPISEPSSKLLAGNIGYVNVPSFALLNDAAQVNFAQKIQDLIRQLDSENLIKGWIIDLRSDGGGNMYPMIAGLGPLLGNGKLGSFINPHHRPFISDWYYRNGASGSYKSDQVVIKNPYTIKNDSIKIAVLIGNHTGSSGEATTISFIGKSNVKLIGEETAGFTTSNKLLNLPNGDFFLIASSYEADRNGKKYTGSIHPDMLIKEDHSNNNEDAVIKAAQSWINE